MDFVFQLTGHTKLLNKVFCLVLTPNLYKVRETFLIRHVLAHNGRHMMAEQLEHICSSHEVHQQIVVRTPDCAERVGDCR